MMKPNFQEMNRKELRAYMLANRDDDDAFYAYMDRLYESIAATETAVLEWLKIHQPHQYLTKIPDRSSEYIMTGTQGDRMGVKIQLLRSSLPSKKDFIELIINDLIEPERRKLHDCMMVFVSKDESSSIHLDRELTEVNFDSRTQYSHMVGYITPGGQFQRA
ncbi:MAG: hypothetical protein AB4352_12585 [Hormoscilla sp.]